MMTHSEWTERFRAILPEHDRYTEQSIRELEALAEEVASGRSSTALSSKILNENQVPGPIPMHHDVTRTLGVLLAAVIAAGCQQRPAEEPQTKDQPASTQTSSIGPVLEDREVEAACGQCKLSLEGGGCNLAVRFDGQAYYVDGTTIDEHGDAHGVDGFCNVIRKAIVSGHVEDGRFVVASFKVLPSGG